MRITQRIALIMGLLCSWQVEPLLAQTPTPTPTGADFTFVALPDTQYYVSSLNGGLPAMFTSQTDWIVANRSVRNVAYVAQLGDCVQNGDHGGNNAEWLEATNALYRLENPITTFMPAGIPYGVAVGNHDQSPSGSATGTTTFYNQYFGEAHFLPYNYYGGHYGANNDNHYDLFSASGMDFIVIYFEYDTMMTTNSPVLAWANSLLQANQNRRAIVVSHWIINAGFNATFGTQGQAIYNVLKSNPNLFLMLCGHVSPPEGQRTDTFNGRTVWTVLSDYQGRTGGGNGWLRLYEFSPSNNVIHVKTYSPWLGQIEIDADSQFDIPYPMTQTPTPTPSPTPTATATATAVATATFAPTPTLSPTPTPTAPDTPTPTATATDTPTPTATATIAPTPTPTPAAITISGTITYCSNPVLPPVPGVTMTLTGSASGLALSDVSGNYQLLSLAPGGSYTVTPTKSALTPGADGIDIVDVIATQRHFLNVGTPLSGCRLTAADVNGDSEINIVDVIAIQRFFLTLTTGIANVGKYQFTPGSRTYPGAVSDQALQNYETLVFGDVAGPYADRPEG